MLHFYPATLLFLRAGFLGFLLFFLFQFLQFFIEAFSFLGSCQAFPSVSVLPPLRHSFSLFSAFSCLFVHLIFPPSCSSSFLFTLWCFGLFHYFVLIFLLLCLHFTPFFICTIELLFQYLDLVEGYLPRSTPMLLHKNRHVTWACQLEIRTVFCFKILFYFLVFI